MARRRSWRWVEAPVSQDHDHFALVYGDTGRTVALVGRPRGRMFPVQLFEGTPTVSDDVGRELTLYLTKLNERDPWLYARYHCGTAANIYSTIHWTFVAGQSEALEEGEVIL